MIKSIEINNIRGIAQGKLEDIAPLTIIVGPNNAGKSTILDAMLLGAHPETDRGLSLVLQRRRVNNPNAWFVRRNPRADRSQGNIIVVEGIATRQTSLFVALKDDAQQNADLKCSSEVMNAPPNTNRPENVVIQWPGLGTVHLHRSPPFSSISEIRLIDPERSGARTPLPQLYTSVVQRGLRSEAKAIIKELLPGVEDIEILTEKQNTPVMYLVYAGGRAIPVELAGDGIQLLMAMSFELATPAGGVVLLEEPETHLHPGAIRQAAKAIVHAVKRDIQVILTTHNLDMIDILLGECGDEELKKTAVFRVLLDDQGILKSDRLPGEEAAFMRSQIGEDLR